MCSRGLRNTYTLDSFWMPFTANRQFKVAPRMVVSAPGMYYRTEDDREVLDGTAGLWCVNAGHGRREIADAVGQQLATLDYAPCFQMGHPLAFQFAEQLAMNPPGGPDFGLDRIFFTGSGSESVDTALKIAIAYQRAIGQGTRTRLIGRERGYHGVGFGGLSVGGSSTTGAFSPSYPARTIYGLRMIQRGMVSPRGNPSMVQSWRTIWKGLSCSTAQRRLRPLLSSRSRHQPVCSWHRRDICNDFERYATGTASS